jgi:Antitoxin Xre-like helix-turn-helix domain/Antitoxin Xre/MbcA/ParS C-terminal toxin-binding domain
MQVQKVDVDAADFAATPVSEAEAAAMFRAALNLFARWEITDEQGATLLDMPVRTYRRWKAGPSGRIGRDARARLSNLMGIHKALRIVFREPHRGYRWIKARNAAFGGRSALEIMLGGELTDVMRVRRYLDAERGEW